MTNLMSWKRGGTQDGGDAQTAPISRMRWDWDRLFDRVLDDVWGGPAGSPRVMPLDLTETDEEIRIRAEVPGVAPEDLDIRLSGSDLMLSFERVAEARSGESARYYSERHYGPCERTVKLPCPVDAENVRAEHRHGIVTITLQKSEAVRPKRIKIEST